jgi:SMI1/KNR4 family protein SUKH-1
VSLARLGCFCQAQQAFFLPSQTIGRWPPTGRDEIVFAMPSQELPADDLLTGLQKRATEPNPERRVDTPQTDFSASVMSMDLGGLFKVLGGAAADLKRVVAANQAGRVDLGMLAKADQIQTSMNRYADTRLPSPADAATLDRTERELGFPLPPTLRRIYAEVGNGGFGPGSGLLPIERVVADYRELQASVPVGRSWPNRLLPLVYHNPQYECVDAASESLRIVHWDPEGLNERVSEARWQRSFSEAAPNLVAWLSQWVTSRPYQEVGREEMANRMRASQIEQARESRRIIAAKTPEERAAMGLPEVGWQKVVWGGIGLEDDAAG